MSPLPFKIAFNSKNLFSINDQSGFLVGNFVMYISQVERANR